MSDTIKKNQKVKCKFLREKKVNLSKKLRNLDHAIGKCTDLLNIEWMLEKRDLINGAIESLARRGV